MTIPFSPDAPDALDAPDAPDAIPAKLGLIPIVGPVPTSLET
jgi:hypothetical protein